MEINFLKNNKSVPELWKREKTDFRVWIIASIASFALSSILSLIIFILRALYNQEFLNSINFFISSLQLKDTQEITKYKANFATLEWNKILMFAIFSTLLLSISTYFFISIYNSYAKKDFGLIAEWPIIIYTFLAIFLFVTMIFNFARSHPESLHGGIFGISNLNLLSTNSPAIVKATVGLEIVTSMIIALTYVAFVRRVRHIRHLFIVSKRSSEVVNILKERMDTMKQFNPFIDLNIYNQKMRELQKDIEERAKKEAEFKKASDSKASSQLSKQEEQARRFNYLEAEFLKTDLFKKISTLDEQKLNEMAKRLSIAGFEFLTKEELLKKILQIFEQEWSDSKSKKS